MQITYGKKIGQVDVCCKIDDSHEKAQVTVCEQLAGAQGKDRIGRMLGFGSADTVAEALSAAMEDARESLVAGK